jgi:transcriptional regulator with XRE-family HTH domain
MANERLRAALLQKGITVAALAEILEVDEKTVERWITVGRMPYRRHRYAAASHLGLDEGYLWPDALPREQRAAASASEIVSVYPHRWSVPRDLWGQLFEAAEQEIGILVYSGLFVAEDSGLQRLFAEKADAGVRLRILLGDPDSPHIAQRGADEGIGDAMAAKVRGVINMYRRLATMDGVEIRLHDTVLYNSIYRADDQLLINTHVYGVAAANAPFLHLRRVAGGDIVNTYETSFERVWEVARPLPEE